MTMVSPEVFNLILAHHKDECGYQTLQNGYYLKCVKNFTANFSLVMQIKDVFVELDSSKIVACFEEECVISLYMFTDYKITN